MVNTRSKHEDSTSEDSTVGEDAEFSLEIIYNEIKTLKSEMLTKIEQSREDIIIQLQNENNILKEEIGKLKIEMCSKDKIITKLSNKIENLENNVKKSDRMIDLERKLADSQQYQRRNNIEINGIPSDISQDKLEDTVLNIASAINVEISEYDIEACHRLKNNNTIVRFTNRKICEDLFRGSKKLKEARTFRKAGLKDKVYINNNLCPYYKFLWIKAKLLKQKNFISRYYTWNGIVHIKIKDDSSPMRITHIIDLIRLFPDN